MSGDKRIHCECHKWGGFSHWYDPARCAEDDRYRGGASSPVKIVLPVLPSDHTSVEERSHD